MHHTCALSLLSPARRRSCLVDELVAKHVNRNPKVTWIQFVENEMHSFDKLDYRYAVCRRCLFVAWRHLSGRTNNDEAACFWSRVCRAEC